MHIVSGITLHLMRLIIVMFFVDRYNRSLTLSSCSSPSSPSLHICWSSFSGSGGCGQRAVGHQNQGSVAGCIWHRERAGLVGAAAGHPSVGDGGAGTRAAAHLRQGDGVEEQADNGGGTE